MCMMMMMMTMMMMMMTLMKLVNSATKFRHGIDKFYQPNSCAVPRAGIGSSLLLEPHTMGWGVGWDVNVHVN